MYLPKRFPNALISALALVLANHLLQGLLLAAPAAELRQTIRLDGKWEIAEGKLSEMPTTFDHTAPVPGLADMATPAFEQVAQGNFRNSDPRREAFWYRHRVTLPEKLPAVVRLKVNKAMFGTTVYVNGKEVGQHMPCFTPGWFDIRKAAGPGENTLVIRVGASPAQLPPTCANGQDPEKRRYIPGIFDSVEVVCCDGPYIENVQVVPKVDQSQAFARVWLIGTAVETSGPVALEVREAKSGTVVGRAELPSVALRPGEAKTVDAQVAIENCQLWSPERPFLYQMTVRTAGDCFETRFGMREFKFIAGKRQANLNGKTYFLRGNNVTLYRFFEDSQRGALPWDEAWVRRLFRLYKEQFHWNSLRLCIGFPPEFWYRLADEEGILIQDEFPLWSGVTDKWDLVTEYTEWMRERWNHPCVVIWDAQNETFTDLTGKAIQSVRALDLSNRSWDNGWGGPVAPTDTWESHPYLFYAPPFTIEKVGRIPAEYAKYDMMHGAIDNPWSGKVCKDPALIKKYAPNPVIINEYEWLWVNRDGTATTLTKGVYETLLGKENTAEKRFYLQARYNAAITEFWRSSRYNAGVLQFTALGYSRPDGQTSDFFRNVATLEVEPNYLKYMPDAFAPVGVMLDFWKTTSKAGSRHQIHIVAINDLDTSWSGSLQLRLLKKDQAVFSHQEPVTIDELGRIERTVACSMPAEEGDYQLEATLRREGSPPVRSLRDVRILAK